MREATLLAEITNRELEEERHQVTLAALEKARALLAQEKRAREEDTTEALRVVHSLKKVHASEVDGLHAAHRLAMEAATASLDAERLERRELERELETLVRANTCCETELASLRQRHAKLQQDYEHRGATIVEAAQSAAEAILRGSSELEKKAKEAETGLAQFRALQQSVSEQNHRHTKELRSTEEGMRNLLEEQQQQHATAIDNVRQMLQTELVQQQEQHQLELSAQHASFENTKTMMLNEKQDALLEQRQVSEQAAKDLMASYAQCEAALAIERQRHAELQDDHALHRITAEQAIQDASQNAVTFEQEGEGLKSAYARSEAALAVMRQRYSELQSKHELQEKNVLEAAHTAQTAIEQQTAHVVSLEAQFRKERNCMAGKYQDALAQQERAEASQREMVEQIASLQHALGEHNSLAVKALDQPVDIAEGTPPLTEDLERGMRDEAVPVGPSKYSQVAQDLAEARQTIEAQSEELQLRQAEIDGLREREAVHESQLQQVPFFHIVYGRRLWLTPHFGSYALSLRELNQQHPSLRNGATVSRLWQEQKLVSSAHMYE